MDEWPELEALAVAVDAWDEYAEWNPIAPLSSQAQALIDAARTVVDNYRTQKAAIEAYRNMTVDRDQVRRMLGLPTIHNSMCASRATPPGPCDCILGDLEAQDDPPGHPGRLHRLCCGTHISQMHLSSCVNYDATNEAKARRLMGLPPLQADDAPRPEMGEYVSHQSGWDSSVTHPGRRATCGSCPGLPTDDSAATRAGAAAADQALDQLGLPVTEPARVKAMIEIPMPEDQQSCACGDPNRPGWYHSRVTGRCYATGLDPDHG